MRSHRETQRNLLGLMLIRADASATLGAGHVMRCLALAQAWRRDGGKITFVSACESAAIREQIVTQGFALHEVSRARGAEDAPAFLWKTFRSEKSESSLRPWVCLDGYHFDAPYQQALKDKGFRVLVIDDTGHLPCYLADILLNQNPHAETLSYPCGPDTTLLLGPRYALIREEFLPWKDWNRPVSQEAHNVLVTVGGGDSPGVLAKIVAAICRMAFSSLDVLVIAGSSAERLQAQVDSSAGERHRFRFLTSTKTMPQLMAWADVAVSAGGSTCWELAYMGLPSLVGVLAENQLRIAQALGEKGMALNLGWFLEVGETEIASALTGIISDVEKRKEMSLSGRKMIDGLGAKRVCDEIAAKGGKGE
jgi:UDP-2,4-diacetamido-2,4,6-trideoxy-beta-L-altropyranose hydrolase